MTSHSPPSEEDPQKEIAELITVLQATQRRLVKLTRGEVDAEVNPNGGYFLLHEAQQRLRESESRFSGAFEHAPIGMALVSLEGRWLKVNRALCEVVGYSEAELLVRTFQEITHPDDLTADLEQVRQLAAGEIHSYQMEKRYIHSSRSVVWVLIHVSLVCEDQGRPLYFIVQIQDITDRRQASASLMESQRRLALATESARLGIWDWDIAANKMIWDDRMYELYGIREQDFGGAYDAWQKGLHPDDLQRAEAEIAAALGGLREFHTEFRVVWPDGQVRHIEGHGVVHRSQSGAAIQMIGVNWDITARKLAEAELENTHRELLDASRRAGKAELATGILHNVGNVLNSVNVASSYVADSVRKSKSSGLTIVAAMLRDHQADLGSFLTSDPKGIRIPDYLARLAERLTAEQAQVLEDLAGLQANIGHIREIVTAQQHSARSSYLEQDTDVVDLIETVLRIDSSPMAEQGIEVVRAFRFGLRVTAEKHKIIQILHNLVRNARQACEASAGSSRRVTLRCSGGDEGVCISVSDNGVGIEPGNLAHIFAHGYTTKKDGHGFGLHSAVLAARQMGAELRVESEGTGLGATFTLELLFRRPD